MRETLSCVQQQKCEDYRVIISVDNKDIKTAEACREFLNDSRFTLKIQDQHLGWAGNINWLMAQGGYEFFCFWQHDDYTSLDYLSSLLQAADANPTAVCCYSDLQWLGDEVARSACPSVTGFPLTRALYFFETMNGVPFRGLIRKRAIERAGPIRLTAYQSAHEEFLWLAKLAREGNLLRVAGPLYFKRKYKGYRTNAKFYLREIGWKRAVWLEYGLGALEIFWPLVLPEDREIALGVVLDRICFPGSDRLMFYDPTVERVAFAAEFLERALARFDSGIRRAMAHSEQKDLYAGQSPGN